MMSSGVSLQVARWTTCVTPSRADFTTSRSEMLPRTTSRRPSISGTVRLWQSARTFQSEYRSSVRNFERNAWPTLPVAPVRRTRFVMASVYAATSTRATGPFPLRPRSERGLGSLVFQRSRARVAVRINRALSGEGGGGHATCRRVGQAVGLKQLEPVSGFEDVADAVLAQAVDLAARCPGRRSEPQIRSEAARGRRVACWRARRSSSPGPDRTGRRSGPRRTGATGCTAPPPKETRRERGASP